ncbi:MAG: non-ribosomal peptide synthetase [Chloroflexota bacterium]|nr:non-ribosomal peptide synthetase [Chloroflexota bacterium]
MIISNEEVEAVTGVPVGQPSTAPDPSTTATVPDLVRLQAARTPDATALRWASEITTYAELATGAARLARHLRRLGVRRDDAVGLCLGRSPASVQAALGVMEAGAAYLPLDPAHPTGRLTATLEDAGARIVITDAMNRARFDGAPLTALLIEDLLGPDADPRDTDEGDLALPGLDDLAYVIYTSGSTGRPKGVDVSHSNLLNLVRWHQAAFSVTAADRGTAIAGPAFDAVVWELWPYLAAGASVAIADEDTRLSADLLGAWLAAERVTICFMPTALAERALALDWPADTSLRILLTGADSLHVYPRPGLPFTLVNNYGPTECTVVATSGPIMPADDDGRLPSIGCPIANVEVHLLNPERLPVAPGEVGELYVGGAGVARGYRNHQELTAERFVPDPWSAAPDGRLYRTGDLARYRDDGTLEFGGRVDAQVKIRGNRVEPEEVALCLDQHPAVQASVVVARIAADGDRHLVAYVVPRPGETPSRSDLGLFLRGRLPEYMVPSEFVQVDAFPLTPNGKVDREALLATASSTAIPAADDAAPYVAPTTTVERRIAELTSTLLKIHQVSVEDDFFLLGGHSLLATQLIVQLRVAFGVEIPLRTIFDQPTVRELSIAVEDRLLEQLETANLGAGS